MDGILSNMSWVLYFYNLSVSTFVQAKEPREVIDINQLNAEIKITVSKIDRLRHEIDAIVVGSMDPATARRMTATSFCHAARSRSMHHNSRITTT
jgi:hypothetical protein